MSTPPILHADVELWATGYLRPLLALHGWTGVIVSNATPTTTWTRLVTVRRDGGSASDVRDFPRLGVNVWAATEKDATDLALLVDALMRAAVNEGPVRRIRRTGGPSPIADESKKPRRYLTYELTTRGEALT